MTMTYDPFTPAGGPEQRGYDGRRRAADPVEGRRQPESRPEWEEGRQWEETQSLDEGRVAGWVEDPRYAADNRYAEDRYAEDRYVDDRWDTPIAAPRPEPAAAFRPGPSAVRGPERTGEPPRWHADIAPQFPVLPDPEPAPRDRGGRAKPVVVGLVVLLVLVAGWQAYRIESMNRHSEHMASVLTAEKDRTDRLEAQLAGVFDPEGVSSSVLPSVFRVRAGDLTGTAFSVGRKAPSGESNLITNYHVVASVWGGGGRKVSLERGTTKITATIEKVDKGKDLALLHADQAIAGLVTAGGEVKPGQQVVVVGAPLGLDDSVTTGVISAYRPDDSDGPTIQFDAPINPGNSGGPVVNAEKRVVGVATAKAKDAEGIGLAIPIKVACALFAVC